MMRGIWPSLFDDCFPSGRAVPNQSWLQLQAARRYSVEIEHPSLSDARIITSRQECDDVESR